MRQEDNRTVFTSYNPKAVIREGRAQRGFYQWSCQVLAALLFTILFLTGCSKRYDDVPAFWPFEFKDYENHSVGRFKTSFLAQQIDEYYQGIHPGPIGVTTFVNLDDLRTTSSFGRIYGEQLMSELSMRGYDVVELRHSDALHFLSNLGEFALSRDVTQVRRERDLGGIVVGTYVVSPVRVYINARLIDPSTSKVLSAGSVEMPKTDEIKRLVRGGAFAPTLERIPVKRLGMYSYPMALNPYYYEEEVITPPPGMPSNPSGMSQQKMMEEVLKQQWQQSEQATGSLQ